MKYKELESGSFGVIQLNKDGTISQIGLMESQSKLLEIFLSSLSSENTPLIRLPKEYNLHLKT